MKARKFVDLFAGCGGLSLGFTSAGLQGVFAVERDEMAFATFAENFIYEAAFKEHRFDWPMWLDQRAQGIDEVLTKHRAELEGIRGSVDVLAGGPPCQGFSFAGRRIENDPRNLLFNKYVEFVEAIQPRALVLENVPGMQVAYKRSASKSVSEAFQPRTHSFYDELAASLARVGYEVKAVLVDASRFGVPQKRSRLIAIGIRRDLCKWLVGGPARIFELLEDSRVLHIQNLGLDQVVSAADAISDLEIADRPLVDCNDPRSPSGYFEATPGEPQTAFQVLMRNNSFGRPDSMRLARHRLHIRERFAQILSECRKGVAMNASARQGFGLKKQRIHVMSPTNPAPTITTLPDDVLHYSEPRILTVRECARLQSFPDWFQFKGKFTTGGHRRTRECPRYTQVGNAVPPLLAQAIGAAISRALDEIDLNREQAVEQEHFANALMA